MSAAAIADLDLEPVVRALAGRDRRREALVRDVLTEVGTDAATIAYRQAVMADFMASPRLCDAVGGVLPLLEEVGRGGPAAAEEREDWGVLELTRRLTDLTLYVKACRLLADALAQAAPASDGLRALAGALQAELGSAGFTALERELPPLREQLKQGQSITLAINLRSSWEPESAAILSIGQRAAGRGNLLGRLFPGQEERALTPLRRADPVDLYNADNPLFRDLRALLEATAAPVLSQLQRFSEVQARALARFQPEFAFFLGAAALFGRLSAAGLPCCVPEVRPAEERCCAIDDSYSLPLALRLLGDPRPGPRRVVPSDVRFDGNGRVWILTGPNRGGKTTFIRAAGVAHVLFAAGLPVPGRRARLSPVDLILTHFATQEQGRPGEGRLDEEAERLAAVFAEAGPHSLILMNEVLAGSTSQIEALALATDAVRGLRLLGARCIYATHLHDLAATVDRINASVPEADSAVGSLVAGVIEEPGRLDADAIVFTAPAGPGSEADAAAMPDPAERGEDEPQPTFRIVPGPPRGQSFASAIAREHGISFEQLRAKLKARGIVGAAGGDGEAPDVPGTAAV